MVERPGRAAYQQGLHYLHATSLAEAVNLIERAKTSGRAVKIWYVHTPVEQAVAQAVTRTASKGRALALPILSSAHYNSQNFAIRLLQKYQGDRYVRIDVLDTATGFVEDPFDLFDF